ncbi:helix-turn-helix domain-containing protein [Rhizobium aegyptiacum]|uniref:helix-turn-helix domain-containing protein n=1 Tax=Rhizobium aegyptiacum TaxID=1764550 RepID=UPI0007E564DA|nr:helix-turn-helix transcriptional regulator [Rhizobium aegyptiacum]
MIAVAQRNRRLCLEKKKPHPTDVEVGSRIRIRRRILNMSQTTLADKLGLTFQQVQKYEKGTNRVGASRLQAVADALEVPVSFFFDPLESTPELVRGSGMERDLIDFLSSAEGIALNQAFRKLTSVDVRRRLVAVVKAAAATG